MTIVQSLSFRDFDCGLDEQAAMVQHLRAMSVPVDCLTVSTSQELKRAVRRFSETGSEWLHIACHGNDHGIQLTDGSILEWYEFANTLCPEIAGKNLAVSACEGGKVSLPRCFSTSRERPNVIVGPNRIAEWRELLVGWPVFYRSIFPKPLGLSDGPCEAVSRAQIAAECAFACHIWNGSEYDRFEPTPVCAFRVSMEAVQQEWKEPISTMELL